MRLRVAGAQMEVGSDVWQNVESIRSAIAEAAAEEVGILLTPRAL